MTQDTTDPFPQLNADLCCLCVHGFADLCEMVMKHSCCSSFASGTIYVITFTTTAVAAVATAAV